MKLIRGWSIFIEIYQQKFFLLLFHLVQQSSDSQESRRNLCAEQGQKILVNTWHRAKSYPTLTNYNFFNLALNTIRHFFQNQRSKNSANHSFVSYLDI